MLKLNSRNTSREYVKPIPALFKTDFGATRTLCRSKFEWDVAAQFGQAIYCLVENLTGSPTIYKYTTDLGWVSKGTLGDAAWLLQISGGASGFTDEARLFFIDSRGYIFISFDVSDKLYVSINDGAHFTEITSVTQSTGGEFRSMTEDNNGHLYAAYYRALAVNDGSEVFLGKSIDGITFTDITANVLNKETGTGDRVGGVGMKHLHSVNFDPFRNILFICPGDGGAFEPAQYSLDGGETPFKLWNGSPGQTISMTFDAKYIYSSIEITGDSNVSIYRAASLNDASEKVVDIPATQGLCWNAHSDNLGNVWFLYSSASAGIDQCRLWATSNNGDAWHDIYPAVTAVTDKSTYGKVSRSSFYAGGEDGYFFNTGRTYRVYQGEHIFDIDEAAGNDWIVNATGSIAEIPDNGGITGHGRLQLVADYAKTYSPGTDRLIIKKGDFDFTGYPVTGTYVVDEDFNTAGYTFDATGGVAPDTNNADITPFEGAGCMKCAATGSPGSYGEVFNAYSAVTTDDIAYWSCHVYFDAAAINSSNIFNLGGINNCLHVEIRNDGSPALSFLRPLFVDRVRSDINSSATAYKFPVQQWVKLKLAVKFGTKGWARLWADDVLVLEAMGTGEATNHDSGWTRARFGATTSQTVNVYYDLMRCSINFDPDKPTAVALNGAGQALLPDGIYS